MTSNLLEKISELPKSWHTAGSLHNKVLQAIDDLPPTTCSVETGTGRSTLLLSHKSRRHLVFCHEHENRTLDTVRSSPLLGQNVEFIVGPTQVTLPKYLFTEKVNLALLDGPHGYPFPELEYYFIYPHIATGGFLILDDIHIPTVTRLCQFLREEVMFEEVNVVRTTAFFRRTSAPLFDPYSDGWWLQSFNKRRYPDFRLSRVGFLGHIKHSLPPALATRLQKLFS